MKDCLPSQFLETKAAVISRHVASGPSSPDAISSPSSRDAHYSDSKQRIHRLWEVAFLMELDSDVLRSTVRHCPNVYHFVKCIQLSIGRNSVA